MNSQSDSKRFLFIIGRGDSFGGSSMHVQDLAARLPLDGHVVKVIIGGTPKMEVPLRLKEKDIDFTCIPSMKREINPLNDLQAIIEIRSIARKFEPDIVSTHASKGGALGRVACLGLNFPVLYTPHCWSFVDGFSLAPVYRLIEKALTYATSRIITVSEDERQFGISQRVAPPEKLITIHNGVLDISLPKKLQRERGSPVELIMIGRFESQKAQHLLLQALSRIESSVWRLNFVGDGPTLEQNKDLCRELGLSERVNFDGYCSDVSKPLANSDVFILATNWEGFPRSILEAMRSGLPVITSDVGGCRESVLDGVTGLVVPKGDLGALANALQDLIGNPALRLEMGSAGRREFLSKYTFEVMYQNYRQLYQRLLDPAKSTEQKPFKPIENRSLNSLPVSRAKPDAKAEASPASYDVPFPTPLDHESI